MHCELPDIQTGFRKGRGTREQIANIHWIMGIPGKACTSALLTMLKPLTVDRNQLWKILEETRVAFHLTCLLRNLYAGQEATVRTRHGTIDLFKTRKGE